MTFDQLAELDQPAVYVSDEDQGDMIITGPDASQIARTLERLGLGLDHEMVSTRLLAIEMDEGCFHEGGGIILRVYAESDPVS